MMDNHCKDCCCAQSWEALGITTYTGQSIPEHIAAQRATIQQLEARVKELDGLVVKWIYLTDMGLPLEDVIVMGEKLLVESKAAVTIDPAHDSC